MKTTLLSFCFAVFALLCSTQTNAQCTTGGSSLATTNSGGHIHSGGIMFNITAKKNLTITCFDIALAHTGVCEIYYRQGPFQGYENSSASWIKVGEVSGLTALGGLTPIPIDVYAHIPAGQTYGFYINRELEGGIAGTVYRPSETSNSTIATNSDLDITGGIAKSALFGEGITAPNSAVYGRVHYLEGFAFPCNTATGQDFTFNTQQQVNDFVANYGSCPNITLNNLVIGYQSGTNFSDITNLSPLYNITGITGELIIRRNPQLTTLNGLQGITSFNGNLRIEGNDLLPNIYPLSGITSVAYLNIRDNAVLSNIHGLQNLTSTSGYLYIRNNAQLTNLDAFQSLTSIGTYIEVFDNPVLQNLNGLQNVTAINGNIIINSNPVLTDISGLRNINSATITGPTGLQITSNPQLSVCNLPNFCTYLSGSGARNISGNKTTCIDVPTVQETCTCPTGNWTFNTQTDIDDFEMLFPNCTNITLNNLVIGYATNDGFSDITNLSPLQNITTVTGELNIRRNLQLTTLNGLQNITSFNGNLRIERNDLLTNISALSNITSVGFLNIRDNAVLSNLNGLHNLTSTSGYLYIRSNAQMTNLDALQNLTTVGTYIEIMDNDNLVNLNGLSGVTAINGNINIHENAVLTDISGLRNITPATITNSGGGLTILNNTELAVCNLPNFCTYLAGSGNRNISGNKTTCIDVPAIINACASACASVSGQNFTFVNQQHINNFGALYGHCPNITLNSVVIGNLSGTITDLTPLQNVTNITGFLHISYASNLTTLHGLNNLKSIGGYLSLANTSLVDISALSSLTTVGGSLLIDNNTGLTNLNGLQSLTSIGQHFDIRNNPITNLDALSSLSSINGYLALVSNPLLTGISGLQNVNPSGIGGGYGLYIENNPQLAVCNLPNFCTYLAGSGARTISGNAGDCISEQAVAIACLPACPTGQSFTFYTQAQINDFGTMYAHCTDITLNNVDIAGGNITDLTPLQNITALTGLLWIRNNPNLTNVNGLSALTGIGGFLSIRSNPALTDISGLININPATITGTGLWIVDNPQLSVCNLPNFCTYLAGSGLRTISGNKTACLNVTAIQATCTCPTGNWTFNTQAQIDEFGALYANCTDITLGNVVIGYALESTTSDITDLTPLQNITAITGYLRIRNNPNLTNVNGLSALTSIGVYLDIWSNTALTDVNGLSALQSIGRELDIRNNNALTNVNGLSAVTSIGGYLYINQNNALTDISGLANINPATITGGIGLYIHNNPQLSVCNLPNLCTYLSNPSATHPRSISNNAGDCISEQAVTNACFWSNITPDDDNILYVNHNVSGSTQTGNSWANAIPQLAVALKWAKQKYDADNTVFDAVPLKIYVATGTYKPLYRADNLDGSNPQDRDNAFVMVKNVQIFGGFAGNETTLEERNYATNPTILNGDIDGTSGLSANDVYHVMVSVGNVGSALLDGFTVSGGYITSADGTTGITVNGSLVRYERGSGLSLTASSPQIRNVLFTGHRTYAGVVSHSAGSNATFVNTLFTGNTAQFGTVYNASSSPVFINSTFSGNTGTDNASNGVAMRNVTSHPKFYNTIVWGNRNANGSTNNIFNSGGGSPTSIPEYYHSLVQGITTAENGNLNGSTNPLFEDVVNGDFSLQVGSPAINAGNNTWFTNSDLRDLAGNPRVHIGTIDMGAYERTGSCLFETVWNGTIWSNGEPDAYKKAIIEGDLTLTADMTACELLLNSGILTVNSGVTLTVNGEIVNTQNADNFIVQSGGNLIQIDDVENIGAITVRRNTTIKHLDYTIWSSPVIAQGLQAFSPLTLANRIRIYNGQPSVNNWVITTGSFVSGKGYMFRAPNANDGSYAGTYIWTGTFTGIPENGEVTATFNNLGTFQSIGNPYPSNIDRLEFHNANPNIGTLHFWTNSNEYVNGSYSGINWTTINRFGDTVAPTGVEDNISNGIISVGQGFVAETNGVIPQVVFNNTMRTSDSGVFFRNIQPEKHRLWLGLSSENQNHNQMLVGYMEEATNNEDFGIDSKLFGYSGSAIYSLIENNQADYIIQGRSLPFNDYDVVSLGFRAVNEGSYTISLSNFDGLFAEGQDIYLKDNFAQTTQNLKDGSYTFVSETGTFNNRFEVVYRDSSLSVSNPDLNNNWIVYKQDNTFYIQTQRFEMSEVVVYDVLGRVVYNAKNINTSTHKFPTVNGNQMLIVKIISTENQTLSKKVKN